MFQSIKLYLCLTSLLAFPLLNALGAAPQFEIEFLSQFDYPGATSTSGNDINNRNTILGNFVDSAGAQSGFILRNGAFGSPITEPDDGSFTFARVNNDSGKVAGYFLSAVDNLYHGFFFSNSKFTQFDLGSASTFVLAINNAGDFGGSFGDFVGARQAFIDVHGNVILINIPGSATVDVAGINRFKGVAGTYFDSAGVAHGFFRTFDGTLTFPIDVPGATSTTILALNDNGWIVGRYTDSSGHEHGFALQRLKTFVFFDVPGSTGTSISGINNAGRVVGRFTDSSGVRHGFLAEIEQ